MASTSSEIPEHRPAAEQELEAENQRLRRRTEDLERQVVEMRGRSGWARLPNRVFGVLFRLWTGGTVAARGKELELALGRWLNEEHRPDGRAVPPPRKEAAGFAIALASRFLRIGTVGLILGGIPVLVLVVQTSLLALQNRSISHQFEVTAKRESIKILTAEVQCEQGKCPKYDPRTRQEALKNLVQLSDDLDLSYMRLDNLNLIHLDFRGATIRNSNFNGSAFLGTDLSDAFIYNVSFENVTYGPRRLRGAQIVRTKFRGIRFFGIDLRSAKMHEVAFEDLDLSSASFEDARLEDVTFRRSDLSSASFEDARLEDVTFRRSNLEFASFEDARLEDVTFRRSNLEFASFEDAQLKEVTIHRTDLYGSKLEDALSLESIAVSNPEIRCRPDLLSPRSHPHLLVEPGVFFSRAKDSQQVETQSVNEMPWTDFIRYLSSPKYHKTQFRCATGEPHTSTSTSTSTSTGT